MNKPLPEIEDLTRPFWDAVQRERLLIQRCADCDTWVWHPRAWCSACYGPNLPWTPVSGRGVVHTYSVVHYAPIPGYADEAPYVLATVRLDEGPQLMTNLVGCAWQDAAIGLPVQVCFEARAGGFKVPQFRPAAG